MCGVCVVCVVCVWCVWCVWGVCGVCVWWYGSQRFDIMDKFCVLGKHFELCGVGLWWDHWSCIWLMGLDTLDFSRTILFFKYILTDFFFSPQLWIFRILKKFPFNSLQNSFNSLYNYIYIYILAEDTMCVSARPAKPFSLVCKNVLSFNRDSICF